jgi:hypothetical protein
VSLNKINQFRLFCWFISGCFNKIYVNINKFNEFVCCFILSFVCEIIFIKKIEKWKKIEMKGESYKVTGWQFEDITTKNGTF